MEFAGTKMWISKCLIMSDCHESGHICPYDSDNLYIVYNITHALAKYIHNLNYINLVGPACDNNNTDKKTFSFI